MVCAFFGHRQIDEEIEPLLERTIVSLIENNKVDRFLVGHNGAFDSTVRSTLKRLSCVYPNIKYFVVLAYRPIEKNKTPYFDFSDTIYPDVLATVPVRYAIDKRNRWMIDKSDYVISFVKYHGGAAKFTSLAEKKGKTVINLASINLD